MSQRFLSQTLLSSIFIALLLLGEASLGFEVDSFYKRKQKLYDSTELLNKEVNDRIKKAISYSDSCNLKSFYTNVHNQISAGSSGFGVIGGMENWAEKNKEIDKIDPPPREESIYYGTSFESMLSMGYWLSVYQKIKIFFSSSKTSLKKKYLQAKIYIRKIQLNTDDPLKLCAVPTELEQYAKEFLAHEGPGPNGGGPGGPPPSGPPTGSGTPPRSSFDNNQCTNCTTNQGPPNPMGGMRNLIDKLNRDLIECLATTQDRPSHQAHGRGDGNLETIIMVNNVRLGSDKLGHFFDQGADYFKEAYKFEGDTIVKIKDGDKKALELGKEQEEGMFGLVGTKIKSYGDMSANYGGYIFWQDLAIGDNPIVKCVEGKLKIARKFDFRHYVTHAWDEGINCSEFANAETQKRVSENLARLNLTCPVDENECKNLKNDYNNTVLNYIISPACKKIINSNK